MHKNERAKECSWWNSFAQSGSEVEGNDQGEFYEAEGNEQAVSKQCLVE